MGEPRKNARTAMHAALQDGLTLVIDIGKSNAKLLLIDCAGAVQGQYARANASVPGALGYPALDVHGLALWMQRTLRACPLARRCTSVIASTHGAALVALGDQGLAWEPLDYEFPCPMDAAETQAFEAGNDFRETLSPELPAGLNAARQLCWLQRRHPQAWQRTRCLLPYAQYWAWLLSGVACSEVSSLGSHTHLWNPQRGCFSSLALARGWAALFAPLRPAWQVLGPVRGAVAALWGLPASAQVHAGVHDSNACLARYLGLTQRGLTQRAPQGPGAVAAVGTAARAAAAAGANRLAAAHPADPAAAENATATRSGQTNGQPDALTLVSSGTWTILLAPGASSADLVASRDMLANVDVTGSPTPTARFMGGREFACLLAGASADAAGPADLQALIAEPVHALPAFAAQGGPFAGRRGELLLRGQPLSAPPAQALDAPQRAALAALYCAQLSAWLIAALWRARATAGLRVIVDGPFAHNRNYLQALQALLPGARCCASVDPVEGTARGAWQLARRGLAAQCADDAVSAEPAALLAPVAPLALPGIAGYHQRWLELIDGAAPAAQRR